MAFSAATRLALNAVYVTFAACPKPSLISGCSCCIEPDAFCILTETPLRQLTADDLGDYAAKVLLTVGTVADFRYFLPRLLDISLHESNWWPDREVLLDKLHLAGWRDWPAAERASLERLFQCVFDDALIAYRDDTRKTKWEPARQGFVDPGSRFEIGDAADWLCAFAQARLPLAPFLERLAAPAFEPVLLDIYWENDISLGRRQMKNEFWNGNRAAMAELADWFNSDEILTRVLRQLP